MIKQYPRYHSNCGLCRPFTLQQALSLNAGTRESLLKHFGFRLGRDGFLDRRPLARSYRQLSEDHGGLTVFVKAFLLMFCNCRHMITCPRGKVKCFSLQNTKYFFEKYCAIPPLTTGKIYGLMIDTYSFKDFEGKLVPFKKLQRAGGWCEPVRKDRTIWFLSRTCERLG